MSVTVQGADIALDRLRKLPTQLRYAGARAINDTAKEVQSFTINKLLPSKFTLRSKGAPWWRPGTRMGFNIRFANKDTLTGEVGSRADWLKLQEEGGTKRAKSGSRISIESGARESKTSVIPRRNKPRSLLGRGKAFKVPTSAGDAIAKREGRALKFLYLLKPSARIEPVLDYVDSGTDIVNRVFDSRFGVRFAEQLAR